MKKAVLMGVPHHNNLGDTAIAIAEKKYIQENFGEYKYYEVSEETLEKCMNKIKKHINEDDLIFLHGGGNLGNEYLYIETARRKVVEELKNNVIMLFPQTMYFHDTEEGRKELQISRDIYSKNKRLLMIAREGVSFENMKKEFPDNMVILTPDIVTYLDKTESERNRAGALMILRGDREANMTDEQREEMDGIVKKYFDKIEYNDTARGRGIREIEREEKLEDMLEKYRNSKLVITDRLHGMIFAAITSTPCIAIGNYNHKVKACAKTLEHLKYIRYIENEDQLEETINYLLNEKFEPYNNSFANNEFNKIRPIIDSFVNEKI